MKVVIVGAGEVGSNIAASLAGTHDVVVIDRDADLVDSLTYSEDVLALHGDGTDLDMLTEAGVSDADMLIASTDADETNLVTCGIAKICGDAFTVARVRRPQYLRPWERSRGAFGVDFMVCTDLMAAETIVEVIGLPTAKDVDTFANGLVQLTEFEIPADSPITGQTVREADRFDSLTFVAVIRDDVIRIPSGETVIRGGDEVIAIGSPRSMQDFSASIAPQRSDVSEVFIAGGGEIGYQTARLLEQRGLKPRLVERDPDRARWLAEHLPKTTVMENDATNREFLERERVGRADVVVAALDTEHRNLLATLLAKRLGVERTVAVVDTADFVDLFETVGIDVAVSPRETTGEEITRFTRARQAENVAIIEGDRAEALELEMDADSVLVGRPIQESIRDLPPGIVIGAIARGGELVVPRGDTVIEAGDHVVVFVRTDIVDEVTELL